MGGEALRRTAWQGARRARCSSSAHTSFPSFPSLPFPEHQSLIGPVPAQSSEAPSPRTELQEYRTQNTKQIGGGLPASMVRESPVARAISGFSLQGLGSVQQRALGSLGQLSAGVGECFTPPSPQGCTGAQAQGWGVWAARGRADGETGEWMAVSLKQSYSCL